MRRYFISGSIVVVIILFALVLITPCSQFFSIILSRMLHVDTTTTTANQDAKAALDQANAALQQAQAILNLMNVVVATMGVFFALVAVGAGALGFLGFSTIKEVREYRGQLQEEMEGKKKDIDSLQEEMDQKKQDIETLQKNLQQLTEQLNEQTTSITREVEDTKTALTYLILGNQLLEEHKTSQAIEAFEKAARLRPKDPQINYDLGRAYRSDEQYDQAITFLRGALDVEPDFPQALFELALTYRYRGEGQREPEKRDADYHLAAEYYAKASQERESYWEALGAAGGIYRRLGDYQRALEYYKQAYEVDKTASYGSGNIASLSFYLGKRDDALEYFRLTEQVARARIDAKRSVEPYWDYYDLALAQLMLGSMEDDEDRRRDALTSYETAIRMTPPKINVFNGVLDNLYLLRRAREAIVGLDEVIKMIEDAKGTT